MDEISLQWEIVYGPIVAKDVAKGSIVIFQRLNRRKTLSVTAKAIAYNDLFIRMCLITVNC